MASDRDPILFWGLLLFVAVGLAALAGAAYQAVDPLSYDEPANWGGVAALAVFGLGFAGLGAGGFRAFRGATPATVTVTSWSGKTVTMPVQGVLRGEDSDGPFWTVRASWIDHDTGRTCHADSVPLRADPTPYLDQRSRVSVHWAFNGRGDPGRMELGFLPAELRPQPPEPPGPGDASGHPDTLVLWWGWGFALVGLLLLAGAANEVLGQIVFRATSVQVEARVVDMVPQVNRQGGASQLPVFAFSLPDGREQRVTARFEERLRAHGTPATYSVGDVIPVRYDPTTPARAAIIGSGFFASWAAPFTCCFFALILGGGGAAMLAMNRRT